MRSLRASSLALLVALTACQPAPPTSARASAAKAKVTAPATSPSAHAARFLRAPASASTLISGTVTIEALPVVKAGLGRLIGQDGNSLVVTRRSGLIGQDGNSLIGQDGNSLIGQDGNSLIGQDGSSVVAAGAGNLIAEDGDAILAADGAGVVAAGAGNAVGGGRYALAEAALPPPGKLVPAAGLAIRVVALADNRALPVGVDEAGKPVYVVYTDAAGGYTLYLPKDRPAGNLRVIAGVGGSQDPRLTRSLIAEPVEHQAFTEPRALATYFVRSSLLGTIADLLATSPQALDNGSIFKSDLLPGLTDGLKENVEAIDRAARESGAASLGPAARLRLQQRIADALLAAIHLEDIDIGSPLRAYDGPPGKALDALAEGIAQLGEQAAARLTTDTHAFDATPFVIDSARRRKAAGLVPFPIADVGDLSRLVLTDYMSTTDPAQLTKLDLILVELGMPQDGIDRMVAAGGAITVAQVAALSEPGGEAVTRIVQAIQDGVAAERARTTPDAPVATPPASPSPAAEPVTVRTLAGSGTKGVADGVGTAASFNTPGAMTLDPVSGDLFIVDHAGKAIRRIKVSDGSNGVSTLQLLIGEPAEPVAFTSLRGLAFDGDGSLYVSEVGAGSIYKLRLTPDGTAKGALFAGGLPSGGPKSGPALQTAFDGPAFLAYDAQGQRLLEIDLATSLIRAIGLGPGNPVAVVSGAGGIGYASGFIYEAKFTNPQGLLVLGGKIYVADTGSGAVRVIDEAAGLVSFVAGGDLGDARDGYWASGSFGRLAAIAPGPDGDLFCADSRASLIRRLHLEDSAGTISTVAGVPPMVLPPTDPKASPAPPNGLKDGPGAQALFDHPAGLAYNDRQKVLYVSDANNHAIRAITWP